MPDLARKRILHIEDNPSNRKAVRHILRRTPYDLEEAVNGEEGLSKAFSSPPDLVLLDIQLPALSGYDVARELRADPRTTGIPIVAVTSYALSGDEPRAFESGCNDYISKPYRPGMLVEKVARYLQEAGESQGRDRGPGIGGGSPGQPEESDA
jgi:two-component system cell cycle response regulator DivK